MEGVGERECACWAGWPACCCTTQPAWILLASAKNSPSSVPPPPPTWRHAAVALPAGFVAEGPVICIELKPKWGFLPSSPYMAEPGRHV